MWKKKQPLTTKQNKKRKRCLKGAKEKQNKQKKTQPKKEKRTLFQAVATGENVVSMTFLFGICE